MKILKISAKNFKEVVGQVAKSIREGKVIVCPTDTVYGLLADAKNEKAVKNIFKIKKREIKKPLPIFVKDLKMAKELARIEKNQEKFLKRTWPGKVTAILEVRKKKLAKGIIKGKKIGIRIPKYKLLNELLKRFNQPLAQTSANISGQLTPMKVKEILSQFKGKLQPDFIIDAGNLSQKPSLIIDLTEFPPKIVPRS